MSDTNARFYHPVTLEVISEVPRAKPKKLDDGTVLLNRNTTLGDAKKMGLLSSVTTIIKDTYATNPQLITWQKDQVLDACILFPFDKENTPENVEAYKAMINAKSNEYRDYTADKGKFIHAAASRWVDLKTMCDDPVCNHMIEQLDVWTKANGVVSMTTEQKLGSKEIGFAGTPDIYCKAEVDIILDIKTTAFKSFSKPYDTWKIQLGAYRILTKAAKGTRLVQMVVDRDTGDCLFIDHEDPDRYADAFMHLFNVWCIVANYDPRKV